LINIIKEELVMKIKLIKYGILILICSLVFGFQCIVQAEKVLTIAQATDAGSIDFDKTSPEGRQMGILIYDWQWLRFQTVESDRGELYSHPTKLIPGIVVAWKTIPNPDGTAVQRLVIRPGAKFHSGNPVTVADLKYTSLRRAAMGAYDLHATIGGMYGPDLEEIDKTMRIIDDYTMEIDVKQPMPSFWETWAQRWYWDSKLMRENATKDDPWSKEFAAKNDAGSGPYVIEKWTPGVEMVVKRFDGYWGPRPPIDKIILRVVPDISSRVMLLKSGAVDVALNLATEEILALRDDPNIKILSAPTTNMLYIAMNPNIEPFDNKDLRWALTYAFPYDEIIPAVYSGHAQSYYGPVPTGVEGALSERRYKTDLNKAKEYLKKAGYEDGLTITLQYGAGFEENEKVGLLYQANLKKIGVDLKLQKLPIGQFSTGNQKRTLPFFITEVSRPWIETAEYVFRLDFLEDTPSNYIGYKNDIVEELTPLAVKEVDPVKRADLNKKIQDTILEDAVWIYIAQPDFKLAMRKNVVGYVAQNTSFHHWWIVDKLE
jgi:peptide/nickel transport system substrate-binding protein